MPQVDWGVFSKKSCNGKQKFFEEHLQREPIFSFNSIKVGDHLVTQNKLYSHHFLCIGKNQANRPEIIHYYGTMGRAIRRIALISSGKAFGLCGKISTMVLPNKSFIKDEEDLLEKKVCELNSSSAVSLIFPNSYSQSRTALLKLYNLLTKI